MTIRIVESSQLEKALHTAIAKDIFSAMERVHEAACVALMHVIRKGQGDVSLCQNLYATLGGTNKGKSFSPARVEALKAWFFTMSGKQITAEGDIWKMKKGWKPENFSSEDEIERTVFYKLVPEPKVTFMSWPSIMKRIQSLKTQLETAVAEDRFKGDPDKIKVVLDNVITYAAFQAAKLTKQETGEVEISADVLISSLDAKGESRAAVIAAKSLERNDVVAGELEDQPVRDRVVA